MAFLYETQAVLADMSANRQQDFGTHTALQPRTGLPGFDVGEVAFDPARHTIDAINPLSLMEMATGMPHVRQVLPRNPLDIQLITHHEAGNDDPRLAHAKQYLAQQLKLAVSESVPGMTDRVHSYHIGLDSEELVDHDTEFISADSDPLVNAKTVAGLCHAGLSFVISDFNRLPLDSAGAHFPATVAVKANHSLEMAMPYVPVRLGGMREARSRRDIDQVNARLTNYHAGIASRLEAAGIAVAQVVMRPQDGGVKGLETGAADASIATALRQISLA